ncbi:DUF4041 domain-containing protein, partial [Escherichia coli]|nr:DUF4041 domain-containing protein [Escherichia coli]
MESKSMQKLDRLEDQQKQLIEKRVSIEDQIENLCIDYKSKKNTYDVLSKQIAIFSEDVELIELG